MENRDLNRLKIGDIVHLLGSFFEIEDIGYTRSKPRLWTMRSLITGGCVSFGLENMREARKVDPSEAALKAIEVLYASN